MSEEYSGILETISEDGKVPKSRLNSATTASALFGTWWDSAQPRFEKGAIIYGIFDGNPPFSRSKRRVQGQSWQPNFSTLEAQSRKDAAKAPYYDLFSSVEHYANAITTKDNPDGLDSSSASRKTTVLFHKMLKRWNAFDLAMWVMLDSFIGFNKGFFWWPNEDSWRFRNVPWNRMFFPEGYSVDIDEWEEFGILHEFPVTKLWEMCDSGLAGWNQEAVIKCIRNAVPQWKDDDPISVQRRLKESVYEPNAIGRTVCAASVFAKEFDGSWTRMMVPFDRGTRTAPTHYENESQMERQMRQRKREYEETKLGEDDWLFYKQNIGEELSHVIAPFFFEVNDGSLNALEGLGKKISPLMQAKDRLACGIVGNAIMRQQILLQGQTASSTPKAGLVQIGGGIAYIPAGYQAQTSQIFGDIEGSLAVNNDFDRRLDTNTGIYRPQFEKPQGNPESATAASLRFGQATVLSNSAVNRFEMQLDLFFFEIFRRAVKEDLPNDKKDKGIQEALRFQKELKKAGVSRKQIEDILENRAITATRPIGNGSPIMRQQSVQNMSPIVPYLGQRGLNQWLKDFTAAFGGFSKVEAYFPKEDEQDEPSFSDWEANNENNDMQQGAQPLFTGEQDHETHAIRHLMAGFGAIQAVQQGADPTTAFLFLQIALPHIAEHAQKIPRESKRKQIEQGMQQLQKGFNAVQKAVEQQRDQRQQQSNLTFDQQLSMQETRFKLDERAAKTNQQLQQKAQKFEQDQTLEEARTRAEINRKNQLANSKNVQNQ